MFEQNLKTEFSRQYRWHLRKLAKGLCGNCGRGPLYNKNHCKACATKYAERALKRYHRAKLQKEV